MIWATGLRLKLLVGALCVTCTLVFVGCAASVPGPQTLPRLFVAGDSTAASYEPNPKDQQGWGAVLQPYFSRLSVVNLARGGRSSRTYITEGHWDKLLEQLRAGDFVILQFGHNDAGALNQEPPGSTRPLRARGTIPGVGAESEEIDNVITGRHETVYTFGAYLRTMIHDVRAKGATPILMTLTKTNHWKDGRMPCAFESYRLWTHQVATKEQVAFVDLSRIIADRYQREGPEIVRSQFIDDTVHTNLAGAQANARDVVSGLRSLPHLPLHRMLSRQGRAVRADEGPARSSVCAPLRH